MIDTPHLEHPFAGRRMLRDMLRAEGITIGRLAVAVWRWPPVPRRGSGWATPALRDTTAQARRAYQPAGKPTIGTETL